MGSLLLLHLLNSSFIGACLSVYLGFLGIHGSGWKSHWYSHSPSIKFHLLAHFLSCQGSIIDFSSFCSFSVIITVQGKWLCMSIISMWPSWRSSILLCTSMLSIRVVLDLRTHMGFVITGMRSFSRQHSINFCVAPCSWRLIRSRLWSSPMIYEKFLYWLTKCWYYFMNCSIFV